MAKKKRKVQQFKKSNRITYNTEKPNRQARRRGIKPKEPPKEEKQERKTGGVNVLSRKVQQAKEIQGRITPPGMTYGKYIEYLKGKRQQLEEKKRQPIF
nr:hypothetical protein [uncultured Catonella sp.]